MKKSPNLYIAPLAVLFFLFGFLSTATASTTSDFLTDSARAHSEQSAEPSTESPVYLGSETDEGKCGEGKCGDSDSKDGEGKCGEGKCGDSDSKDGKCGEGKCGDGDSEDGEGKCGEGKCGG